MRILIVSDSHGEEKLLHRIVEREGADHVIHCGDFCTDRDRLPRTSLTVVRGNCDWEPVPEEEYWDGGKWRFLVVHGHLHQVKTSLLPVRYRAEELGARIACFGHSHYPLCEQLGDVLLINPGSITQPRGFAHPTFAVLETESESRVRVSYFTPDGAAVPERGGIFDWKPAP
ncbi:metallophosphoesterase family protein [Desmospora profundinema]|uniref:Phosphoesterase n=1 Tax=Desmospora profundinema TaxID=1571184 RepID=A0ABU1INV0_9BACL|nr:metallophosphoesterase [Desmospora profundinema]MDR6226466.1 putative phosphoesterase [Desmospora profundinema]